MKLKDDYRISEEPIAAVKDEERPWAVIQPLLEHLVCPNSQRIKLLQRLTPGQRAFYALHGLVAEIYNGGIHQYYWNSAGDDALAALEALELIDAKHYVPILQRSIELFPTRAVLKDRRRRQAALKKISTEDTYKRFDEPFYDLNDKKSTSLLRLQIRYLKGHPEDFFLPAGAIIASADHCEKNRNDHRVSRAKSAKLRGEALHWALIAKIWDDYWEALKAGRSKAETFAGELSPGQRALIAIDILNKVVLRAGMEHFMAIQIGGEFLIGEVIKGYRLLEAKPYLELFERAVNQSGDVPKLAGEWMDSFNKYQEIERRQGENAAATLKTQSRELYKTLAARREELRDAWYQLSDEFKDLLGSPAMKIERYVEAYVDAHPDELFRP